MKLTVLILLAGMLGSGCKHKNQELSVEDRLQRLEVFARSQININIERKEFEDAMTQLEVAKAYHEFHKGEKP